MIPDVIKTIIGSDMFFFFFFFFVLKAGQPDYMYMGILGFPGLIRLTGNLGSLRVLYLFAHGCFFCRCAPDATFSFIVWFPADNADVLQCDRFGTNLLRAFSRKKLTSLKFLQKSEKTCRDIFLPLQGCFCAVSERFARAFSVQICQYRHNPNFRNSFVLSFFLSILSRSNFDHHLRCGGWLNFEFS